MYQRVLKRRGLLQADRESLLSELGFDLSPRENRFESDCAAIELHIETTGHLPRNSGATREERRLASNVRLWRVQRESGDLPEWKRRRLDEITGFYWTVLEESLAPIEAFIKVHGRRPNERSGATAAERQLAARLRAIEKRRLASSEAQRVGAVLADLPQHKTRVAIWFETADHLESFVTQSGRLPRYGAKVPEEARLATWANEQRQKAKSDSLSRDRVDRLDRIPGWFWEQDLDQRFREDARRVEAHVRRYGSLPSRRSTDPEEARLARWCSSRKKEARGTGGRQLAAWKRERLRQIPGFLSPEG